MNLEVRYTLGWTARQVFGLWEEAQAGGEHADSVQKVARAQTHLALRWQCYPLHPCADPLHPFYCYLKPETLLLNPFFFFFQFVLYCILLLVI